MGAIHKGKMPRLALSLVAVIAMVLGLMPGAGVGKALADDAGAGRLTAAEIQVADATYPLWVGETQVTSTTLKDEGWSFAPAANGNPATLTLSGYNYTGSGHVETLKDYDGNLPYYRHAPIFWNSGSALVVELAGENSIVVTADSAGGGASGGGSGEDCYCGIFCAGNLTVKGTGSLAANAGGLEDGDAGINGCIMTVKGGSVQATGSSDKAYGVSAINSRGESGNGSLVIEEGVASFVAQGPAGAINAEGADLSGYKRVLFPAAAASVTTPPAGKKLSFTGKPQELVTAGAASGGTMQYSLDGKTYAADLPTATEPGEYTIYYKVAGDASHVDSQAQTVASTIAAKGNSTKATSVSGSGLSKTGDAVSYAVPAATVFVALAAAALAIAARRRQRTRD